MLTETMQEEILQHYTYTPRQLTQSGYIKNNRGNDNSYNFILKEIKRGRLIAENRNPHGLKPAYVISAQNIIIYLQNVGKPN